MQYAMITFIHKQYSKSKVTHLRFFSQKVMVYIKYPALTLINQFHLDSEILLLDRHEN